MRIFSYIPSVLFAGIVIAAACNKETPANTICTGDCVTINGELKQQGPTTYQYGTHILTTSSGKFYVLKSETINLTPFENKEVKIKAQNLHYTVEQGPELHNIISIATL